MAGSHSSNLYSPLHDNHVRLLSFKTFEADNITVDLETFPINDAPTYASLSYRWGRADADSPVQVNGQARRVHRNLAQALRSLAHQVGTASHHPLDATNPFPYKHFWVDGLCINQEDVVERGHQVQVMGRIYEQASTVLVHVGGNCVPAIKLMQETYDAYSDQRSDQMYQFVPPRFDRFCAIHEEIMLPFLEDPYWRRIWIVQEVLLARNILLLAGREMMPLSLIAPHFHDEAKDESITLTQQHHSFFAVMVDKPVLTAPSTRFSFLDMPQKIHRLKESECGDEMDRVYGLLGLVDWSKTPNIEPLLPDYTIGTIELSRRIATRLASLLNRRSQTIAWRMLARGLGWQNADWRALMPPVPISFLSGDR